MAPITRNISKSNTSSDLTVAPVSSETVVSDLVDVLVDKVTADDAQTVPSVSKVHRLSFPVTVNAVKGRSLAGPRCGINGSYPIDVSTPPLRRRSGSSVEDTSSSIDAYKTILVSP
ncbi:hypothetical protein FQR65_LT09552 [Abscondita terminalis]|nr:hypothetical protein FQR65_LT09552 [Abscondita terminalis]